MIKQIQNLIKRNYVLIFVAIIVFALMSIRNSTINTSARPYRTAEELYAKLQFDEIRPFQVIMEPEVKMPEKVKHVAFLKVHKSGSTTAQNMFLRFGWDNNLTFVLPHAYNPFKYPNIISLRESLTKNNTLKPPSGKKHDILCNHVIYNRTAFRNHMPNDTVFIGIVREPYEMFKSTLNYIRPGYIYNKIKKEIPASEYLKNPSKYEPKSPFYSFTNNRMAVEFGCPEAVIKSKSKEGILRFIKQLDEDFGLVIIAEYFEESIIMLRRILNWGIKDVLYLDKNVAKHKNETSLVGPFDRQMYKTWGRIDYALYEHFFRKLREQIRKEGPDFDEEMLYFREVRKMTVEFCKGTKQTKSAKLVVESSKWSRRFELLKRDCDLLQKNEMAFVQDVRVRQYGSKEI